MCKYTLGYGLHNGVIDEKRIAGQVRGRELRSNAENNYHKSYLNGIPNIYQGQQSIAGQYREEQGKQPFTHTRRI